MPHGCSAGSHEWETLSASPVSFSEAFRQSRSWWWTRDALCVCGHLACDEHSSTDDDGPYGDMCLYCGCDRSSFDAFIATTRWPVRAIVRLSRAWWTSSLRIGLADITHDCGRVFSLRLPHVCYGALFVLKLVSSRSVLARPARAGRPRFLRRRTAPGIRPLQNALTGVGPLGCQRRVASLASGGATFSAIHLAAVRHDVLAVSDRV